MRRTRKASRQQSQRLQSRNRPAAQRVARAHLDCFLCWVRRCHFRSPQSNVCTLSLRVSVLRLIMISAQFAHLAAGARQPFAFTRAYFAIPPLQRNRSLNFSSRFRSKRHPARARARSVRRRPHARGNHSRRGPFFFSGRETAPIAIRSFAAVSCNKETHVVQLFASLAPSRDALTACDCSKRARSEYMRSNCVTLPEDPGADDEPAKLNPPALRSELHTQMRES